MKKRKTTRLSQVKCFLIPKIGPLIQQIEEFTGIKMCSMLRIRFQIK
jgi:hypothetical protein